MGHDISVSAKKFGGSASGGAEGGGIACKSKKTGKGRERDARATEERKSHVEGFGRGDNLLREGRKTGA